MEKKLQPFTGRCFRSRLEGLVEADYDGVKQKGGLLPPGSTMSSDGGGQTVGKLSTNRETCSIELGSSRPAEPSVARLIDNELLAGS